MHVQGILKLSPDSSPTGSPVPAPQRRRVSFHTDHAPKPISPFRLAMKGEWSMFKRPHAPQSESHGPSMHMHKPRLGVLFFGSTRGAVTSSASPGFRVSSHWEYFTQNIVRKRPSAKVLSRPMPMMHMRKPPAPPPVQVRERPSLKRKPNVKFAARAALAPPRAPTVGSFTRPRPQARVRRTELVILNCRAQEERRALRRTRSKALRRECHPYRVRFV
ncbi:hypothetical protein B0H15DRAFT_159599 [Mycena belliarum]|uniref:Uncharacterized protein n=1 Tax=Mycena belliarum TaxID=1033014 RepID=A0AAD6U771_9AGAR|nr:hypothetical protein B0H15DRAFT_159599 [Mycena belliae]